MEGRSCLYCSKAILNGRSDKKFCDAGCKDAYYNAIKRAEQGEISKIDGILKRNRRILKKLYDSKHYDRRFKREQLLKEGFEFGFQTHVVITRIKSSEIKFCYDYGYRETGSEEYEVFQSFSSVQVKDGSVMKVNGSE